MRPFVSRSPDTFALLIAGVAVLALAWPILGWWLWEWRRPDSASAYAPIVPVLAALLVYQRRRFILEAPRQPEPLAFIGVALSLGLLLISVRQELLAAGSVAVLALLFFSVLGLLGPKKLRELAVPLGMLVALPPLPGPLLSDLTLGAQKLSTTLATQGFQLMGLHPVQNGMTIQLDRYAMEVEAPCSGFKLLLTLLVLGGALAGLTDLSRGRKWLLLLGIIPLALLINALRIILVGLIGEAAGFSAAQRLHDASGYASLVLCLTALLTIAHSMGCKRLGGYPLF
ncbi:MAG: exosortase/archaeosortase family protein [Armatimonas sp.]